MKEESRSPLKDRPLRNPGQSVEERRRDLLLDRFLYPFTIAVVFTLFAFMEVMRVLTNSPPMPWLWGTTAAVTIVWAVIRVWTAMPEIQNLRLAVEGEKAVGQFLEKLRADGYEVFHDVRGQDFNLDHVIIGPAGICTVETKSWSKPGKGDPKIVFDGAQLTYGGREPDRDPIIQARAQASWLGELLKQSTGKSFYVRPVVLFPGWFVEQAAGSSREIWILNPKALPEFLRHEPQRLAREDVKLAAFHLSRFVRQTELAP